MQLKSGVHSLKLRDAEGIESAAKSVTVAPPIVIGEPTYTCQEGQFSAAFTITGGSPPYTVDGKPIPADTFTTAPAASGSKVSVQVADSNDCTASASFTHTCPPPCTLPCDGIALRRKFRFWIPDPDPNNPYKAVRLTVRTFSVEAAPGKPVDLAAKVGPILKARPADLTPAAFPALAASWVTEINKVIAADPQLNEPGKAQWLTLGYEALAPGRLGVLWIDHFECLTFNIEITANIVLLDHSESATVAYAPSGTTIQAGDAKTGVPASDGTRTDKCSTEPVPKDICPTAPDFTLKISPETQTGMNPTFQVATTPDTPELTFLWEAQNANPAMGNGPKFITKFTSQGPKLVTVTAFTKAGCTVTQSVQINIVG